jgi:hypothetical protein
VQEAKAQAIGDLALAGFNVRSLGQVDFHIVNLPASLLGLTYQRTFWIDQNAQGYGWYTDAPAASNAAFTQVTGDNEFQAAPGSPAYGHVDLLTVVTHELGHVLDFASVDASILCHDWMTATLDTGVRRFPDAAKASEPAASSVPTSTAPFEAAVPESGSIGSALLAISASVGAASPSGHEQRSGVEPAVRAITLDPNSVAVLFGLAFASNPNRLLGSMLLDRRSDLPLVGDSGFADTRAHLAGLALGWTLRAELKPTDSNLAYDTPWGRAELTREQLNDEILRSVFDSQELPRGLR